MSPEQAAGRNDDLDERSDIFALSMLFYEFLVLEHPLQGIETIQEILATLIAKDIDQRALGGRALDRDVPVEYVQFLVKGLERDREKRFRSVEEMETGLRNILAGKITACCHISLTKKTVHGMLHWIDRHPKGFTLMLFAFVLGTVGAIVWGGVVAVRALLA
jgi:serine/threonine protein kinase